MKIFKIADYCSGDFGEPTGHLDSQIFPCKKDPSIESRKRRKKTKKAGVFNLGSYLKASFLGDIDDTERNPELMAKLDPSKLELFKELRREHPDWSMLKTIQVIREGLIPPSKPGFPSQTRILRNI